MLANILHLKCIIEKHFQKNKQIQECHARQFDNGGNL